eukprot:TRINITY_DN15797_c0_g1_i1.p1 TRINITY_DN15797_c0_g1~~TRINITY_DN15797_c0_g1_i1.p1  ORF type:complete len:425 (+),score=60.06 TRINITY_DN15797_c0_g1_i1:340-1614(+)
MWSCRKFCKAAWLLTCALVIIAVPVLALAMLRANYDTHSIAWSVGGIFVVLALPISFFDVTQHLENYTRPPQQKKIIRILLMVPVYAVDAWLALRFKDLAIYIDTVRECYEAYVIYSFFEFLVAYVGDEHILASKLSQKPPVHHIWPFTYVFQPWAMGEEFIRGCKAGVHNYVVLRPLTTLIALFCEWGNVYGQGQLVFDRAYLYLAFVNNASQIWAVYCLVLFYQACHEELAQMGPLAKFLCVKAVVFFSWWQSVLFDLLFKFGVITAEDSVSANYDREDVSLGIQDFLICVEMFVAAIAHTYAFSAKEYMTESATSPRRSFWSSLRDMLDLSDITNDMYGRVQDTTQSTLLLASSISKKIQPGPAVQAAAHVQLPLVEHNETRSRPTKVEIARGPEVGLAPLLLLAQESEMSNGGPGRYSVH